MTAYEEIGIRGGLDALDEGKDPRNDPPDTGDEVYCDVCGAWLKDDETTNVEYAEGMCWRCLVERKPEIGELIVALKDARATFERIERIRPSLGVVRSIAEGLGVAQGAATVALAKLKALGI